MRFYIAYKYSNNKNKEELKKKLEKISEKLAGWDHSTFILGRDVKRWKHIHFGSVKLIPVIYKNMRECDILFAYVDSPNFSKGLFFEIIISKLLGKKSILVLEGQIKSKFFKHVFNKIQRVENIEHIEKKHLS